jgi:hypothetical protein
LGSGVGFCTFVEDDPTTSSAIQTSTTSWTYSKSSSVFDNTPTPIKTNTNLHKKIKFHYIKIFCP